MDSQPVEMAALGRPLYLGMLYDCRNDSFIPGVTLWSKDTLLEDVDVHRQPRTDLKISASDSVSDKANFMDISASLKASFLGGLVEVGGSAKYLHDTKSSTRQSRVTMYFSQTTRFEQLTMNELSKITYPQVFDQQTATHVVTGVLYGAKAIMVFDYMSSDNEDQQEVEGNLHVMIKSIPSFSVEGSGAANINEKQKKMADNISVTFHGDYELEKNATTYQEAIEIYKDLPHLLKDKESDAVPVRVWLYPLKLLNDKAASMAREISNSLISQTEHLLEELQKVERRCNDLIGNRRVEDFLDLKGRLQTFQELYHDYKIQLQKTLYKVLPSIRYGKEEELLLADILSTQYTSPFAPDILNQWLDDFTTELNILDSYMNRLKDVRVVKSVGQLNATLFDPAVDVVVCLTFTSLKYEDAYLDDLKEFVKSGEFIKQKGTSTEVYSFKATKRWFTFADISKTMRKNFFLLTSFLKANKTEKGIQFVVASISDPTSPGMTIQLYQNGQLTDQNFEPVTKPPSPLVDFINGNVALLLQESPTGKTVRFKVEYKIAGEAKQEENWETKYTTYREMPYVLTGLQHRKKYLVRYRAVGVVGVSEESESEGVNLPDECRMVGGAGGGEHTVFTGATLTMIRVLLGNETVDEITVTFSDNEEKCFGTKKGQNFREFLFEKYDRFRSLTLWPNRKGNRLGGLSFTVARDGEIVEFSAKIPNVGQGVNIDVGSGIYCGMKVRSGVDVDALGFFFLK